MIKIFPPPLRRASYQYEEFGPQDLDSNLCIMLQCLRVIRLTVLCIRCLKKGLLYEQHVDMLLWLCIDHVEKKIVEVWYWVRFNQVLNRLQVVSCGALAEILLFAVSGAGCYI